MHSFTYLATGPLILLSKLLPQLTGSSTIYDLTLSVEGRASQEYARPSSELGDPGSRSSCLVSRCHQRAQYESPVGKEKHRWKRFICLTASVLRRKSSQLSLLPHVVGFFKDQRRRFKRRNCDATLFFGSAHL